MKYTIILMLAITLTACQRAKFTSVHSTVERVEVPTDCPPPAVLLPQNCRALEIDGDNLVVLCDDGVVLNVLFPRIDEHEHHKHEHEHESRNRE